MPELTGIEAMRHIRHDNDDIRALVLTAYDDPANLHTLLSAVVDRYILKIAAGRHSFDASGMAKAMQNEQSTSASIESLSERVNYAACGLTNKQIGHLRFIFHRTVQGQLQTVYQKFGVETRTETVTAVLSRGLITLKEGGHP